ncbi:MAG: N-acetylglucosamine-6-phosphate deacetylase [Flexilinea sp.]
MEKILIKNARIYTPTSSAFSGWLLIDRNKILNFHKGLPPADLENENLQIIDAAGKILLPGFIDTHTHGSLGFCTMDADPDKIRAMARRNAEHGVTSFLPTSLSDKKENILRAIKAASSMVGVRETGSKVLGIHLEGPFFNPVKAGAQDPDNIRRAQKDEIAEYLDAGIIKQISMAPEYPENLSAADIFVEKGITVAAGHTNANYDQLVEAANHGYSVITHLFNGMGAFGHREPGTIGGALTIPDFSCEMICDNIHSHPAAQKLAWLAKGKEKIILITDTVKPSGLPDGIYPFTDKEKVIVSENGTNLRLSSGNLAGSALTMNRALRNFTVNTGASLEETWRCSSLNAAVSLGISGETGSIEKGKLADLVLLDDNYEVNMTMIEGTIVYTKGTL